MAGHAGGGEQVVEPRGGSHQRGEGLEGGEGAKEDEGAEDEDVDEEGADHGEGQAAANDL